MNTNSTPLEIERGTEVRGSADRGMKPRKKPWEKVLLSLKALALFVRGEAEVLEERPRS
jgi:hypothetical protein